MLVEVFEIVNVQKELEKDSLLVFTRHAVTTVFHENVFCGPSYKRYENLRASFFLIFSLFATLLLCGRAFVAMNFCRDVVPCFHSSITDTHTLHQSHTFHNGQHKGSDTFQIHEHLIQTINKQQ